MLTRWVPGYDIFLLGNGLKPAVVGCLTNSTAPPPIA